MCVDDGAVATGEGTEEGRALAVAGAERLRLAAAGGPWERRLGQGISQTCASPHHAPVKAQDVVPERVLAVVREALAERAEVPRQAVVVGAEVHRPASPERAVDELARVEVLQGGRRAVAPESLKWK